MNTMIEKIRTELDRLEKDAYTRFDDSSIVSVLITLGEIHQFLNTLEQYETDL